VVRREALSAVRTERRDRRSPAARDQLNANASKLEHNSTRLAAISARNPPETKS
jgi:hypothetical protein